MSLLHPGEVIVDARGVRYIVASYTGDGYMAYRQDDPEKVELYFPEELL